MMASLRLCLRRGVGVAALVFPSMIQAQPLNTAKQYQTVGFDFLSGFDVEMPDPLDPEAKKPDITIPSSIKALNGKQVAIRGFMLPIDLDAKGVSKFMLNASFDMCYFGAPVRFNDWVMVTMKGGKKAKFTHLATNVFGRLEVGEEVKDGRVVSIYRLAADGAETAK